MDPLLKEFLIFFAFWPMVIVATIFVGMRLGRWMSSAASATQRLKPVQVQSQSSSQPSSVQ